MTVQSASFQSDEAWFDAPLGAPPLARASLGQRPSPPDPVPTSPPEPVAIERDEPTRGAVDYESALTYVRQIGNAMRAADTRIRAREESVEELTRQSQEQMRRAEEALRLADERVRDAAFQIRAAEQRAIRAETKAREAEAWLSRLFDTMQQELQAVQTGLYDESGRDDPSAPR